MRPYGLLIIQLSYLRVLYAAVTMYKVERLSSSKASPLLILTAKARSSCIGVDTVMKAGLRSLPSTLNYEPREKRSNIRKSVSPKTSIRKPAPKQPLRLHLQQRLVEYSAIHQATTLPSMQSTCWVSQHH